MKKKPFILVKKPQNDIDSDEFNKIKSNINDIIFAPKKKSQIEKKDFAFIDDILFNELEKNGNLEDFYCNNYHFVQGFIDRQILYNKTYFLNKYRDGIFKYLENKGYNNDRNNILFFDKPSGMSIGNKLLLRQENKVIFIKSTDKSTDNSSTKLTELFYYKLLELVGYGSKVDFFATGLIGQFLIASDDLSSVKVKNNEIKETRFKCAIDRSNPSQYGKNKELHNESILFLINFLRLDDITNNHHNYGVKSSYVNQELKKEKAFIIDFLVTFDFYDDIVSKNKMKNWIANCLDYKHCYRRSIMSDETVEIQEEKYDQEALGVFTAKLNLNRKDDERKKDYFEAVERILKGRNNKPPLIDAINLAFNHIKEIHDSVIEKQNEKDIEINRKAGSDKDFCTFSKCEYDLEKLKQVKNRLIEICQEVQKELQNKKVIQK